MKITDLKSISREETKSLAQNMTLTNHEAFAKVFSKEECVKELVEVLMDEKITLVESKVEWRLMNEGYRGVVLDLCCILKDGRMVDVEIQNYNEKDIQLRSRYHIACH